MDINKGINITLGSDCDLEELYGEIFFDGRPITRLTIEEGPDNMQIEFFPWAKDAPREPLFVPLSDFEKGLRRVKEELIAYWERGGESR